MYSHVPHPGTVRIREEEEDERGKGDKQASSRKRPRRHGRGDNVGKNGGNSIGSTISPPQLLQRHLA